VWPIDENEKILLLTDFKNNGLKQIVG
jgi:hypothetical protein